MLLGWHESLRYFGHQNLFTYQRELPCQPNITNTHTSFQINRIIIFTVLNFNLLKCCFENNAKEKRK